MSRKSWVWWPGELKDCGLTFLAPQRRAAVLDSFTTETPRDHEIVGRCEGRKKPTMVWKQFQRKRPFVMWREPQVWVLERFPACSIPAHLRAGIEHAGSRYNADTCDSRHTPKSAVFSHCFHTTLA